MQIASALAGFTLGEADILRKAMGKKKADVMATQKDEVREGLRGARRPREEGAARSGTTWSSSPGYGFNKSHSAAYAWLAYQTGYLKANYPSYFMAALLTSERANTDKMVQYIGECREMGIRVLPPDVNESDIFFTVVPGAGRAGRAHPLRPGRHQERGRGRGGGDPAARAEDGPLPVALRLLRARRPARRQPARGGELRQERLLRLARRAAGGALRRHRPRDGGGPEAAARPRAGPVEPARPADGRRRRTAAPPMERLPDVPAWGEGERLAFEKESLGFFITGHPLERFRAELAAVGDRHHRAARRSWPSREVTVGRHHHRPAAHQDEEGRPHGHASSWRTWRAASRCWSSRRPTRRSRGAWPTTRSCW